MIIYQKATGLSMGGEKRVVGYFLLMHKLIITIQINFCAIYPISPFSM
jgi:hypothetical protein